MATSAELVTAIAAQNWQSAHRLALELAAEAADKVSKAVGDLRLDLSDKHANYLALAKQMQAKLATTAVPFAGGISVADKSSRNADSDRVPNIFTRELHDYNSLVFEDDDD